MSKELEDLNCGEEVKTKYGVCYAYSPDVIEEVKKSLYRLEEIDNADPSKALKCLNRIREFLLNRIKTVSFQDLRDIEQALIKMQNNEYKVAFDLINKKRVDIKLLHWAYPSCEAYNVAVREKKETWPREELTEEEFEFIGRLAGAR